MIQECSIPARVLISSIYYPLSYFISFSSDKGLRDELTEQPIIIRRKKADVILDEGGKHYGIN